MKVYTINLTSNTAIRDGSEIFANWSGGPLYYDTINVVDARSENTMIWDIRSKVIERICNQSISKANFASACIPGAELWDRVPEVCKRDLADSTIFFTNILAQKYVISIESPERTENQNFDIFAAIITRSIVRKDKDDKVVDVFYTGKNVEEYINQFRLTYCAADNTIKDGALTPSCGKDIDTHNGQQLFWDTKGEYYRVWKLKHNQADRDISAINLVDLPDDKTLNTQDVWSRVQASEVLTEPAIETPRASKSYTVYDIELPPDTSASQEWDIQSTDFQATTAAATAAVQTLERLSQRTSRYHQMQKTTAIYREPDYRLETSIRSPLSDFPDKKTPLLEGADNLLIPYETLVRFNIEHSKLLSKSLQRTRSYQTKIFTDATSVTQLFTSNDPSTVINSQIHGSFNDTFRIGSLLSLMFHEETVSKFSKIIPLTFTEQSELKFSDMSLSSKLYAEVTSDEVERPAKIRSVSFQINSADMKWTIPFQTALSGNSELAISIITSMTLNIYWPLDDKKWYIYGYFFGTIDSVAHSCSPNVITDFIYFPEENDTNPAVTYHMRFANSDYSLDEHHEKLVNIWNIVAPSFQSGISIAASIILPDLTPNIEDSLNLLNSGFSVTRSSSESETVYLDTVFGNFVFKNEDSWKPFGDVIKIKLPNIGVRIVNLCSITPINAYVRIEENLKIKDQLVPIIFETNPYYLEGTTYRLSYISRPSEGLSLKTLIEWLTLNNLDLSDIPGLSTSLEKIKLSSFSLGWVSRSASKTSLASFSPKPDFVELAIEMGRTDIVPNILTMKEMDLELHINLPPSGLKSSVTAIMATSLAIGQCDAEFLVTYGVRSEWTRLEQTVPGHLKFMFRTSTKPLSLSNILGHFMPNQSVLPDVVHTILTRTGITRFELGVDKAEFSINQIAMLLIEVMLEVEDINIFDGFDISKPSFSLQVDYPNQTPKRTIMSTVKALTKIGDVNMIANISFETKQETLIKFNVSPAQGKISLRSLLTFLGQKVNQTLNLEFPSHISSELSSFIDFNCGMVDLSFSKRQGKSFGLARFALEIQSAKSIALWESPNISLANVRLMVDYNINGQKKVEFSVILNIDFVTLSGLLAYSAPGDATLEKLGHPQNKRSGTWNAVLKYKDYINFHSVLSSLIGINVTEFFDSRGLTTLSKATDIRINSITMALMLDPQSKGILLDAKLDRYAISSVKLYALKGESWNFGLTLVCEENLLELLPGDWNDRIKMFVTLGCTTIRIFSGEPDIQAVAEISNHAKAALKGKCGIMITTLLKFGGNGSALSSFLGKKAEMQVFGAVGIGFFILGVRSTRLEFMDKKFVIQPAFVLSYENEKFKIGADCDFELLIPDVSADMIQGTLEVAVDFGTPAFGLVFKFATVSKLRNVFNIKGFEVGALGIGLEVTPAAEFMPTAFAISGGVKFEGLENVSGSVAVGVDAKNPTNCYLHGILEKLNLRALLERFGPEVSLPDSIRDFLKENGIDLKKLAIELALKTTTDITGTREINQGFYFEGALSIITSGKPVWAGYTRISIRTSNFGLIALMEPFVLFDQYPDVFSLKRNKEAEAQPVKLEFPSVDPEYLTDKMRNDGPIFQITPEENPPIHISAILMLMGKPQKVYLTVNSDSFCTDIDIGGINASRFNARVDCAFKSTVFVAGSVTLKPPPIGLGLVCQLDSIAVFQPQTLSRFTDTSISVTGNLSFKAGWSPGTTGLSISLSAQAAAFGKIWDMGEIGTSLSEPDIQNIGNLISRVADIVKQEFTKKVNEWIAAGSTVINDAIRFVKDTWDAGTIELVRIMTSVKKAPVIDSIWATYKTLDLSETELWKLFKNFGLSVMQYWEILKGKLKFWNTSSSASMMSMEVTHAQMHYTKRIRQIPQISQALLDKIDTATDSQGFLVSKQAPPDWYIEEEILGTRSTHTPKITASHASKSSQFGQEEYVFEVEYEPEMGVKELTELIQKRSTFNKEDVIKCVEFLLESGLPEEDIAMELYKEFGVEWEQNLEQITESNTCEKIGGSTVGAG